LTKADFLKCLTTTHSRLRSASQLDEVHLDRITGRAGFFSVSDEKFCEIAGTANVRIHPCFVVDAKGELHYSKHYQTVYQNWMRASNTHGATSHGALFGVPVNAVRHFGKMYIESGIKRLQLYSVFLFDKTKLPADESLPGALS
jgi:hypothetical protein